MQFFAKYLPAVGICLLLFGGGISVGKVVGATGFGRDDLVFGVVLMVLGALAILTGVAVRAVLRRRSHTS